MADKQENLQVVEEKKAVATLKYARISSRKVKIVADLIRGKNAEDETINISNLAGDKLIKYDIVAHRFKVNKLLLKTSESVRKYYKGKYKSNFKCKKFMAGRPNLINADLRRNELRGENLSSALLIAANLSKMDLSGIDFLGADLRDTDITGSNLRNAVYLTQFQINSAKGDGKTVLSPTLQRPFNWIK